jgi:XTP/dITP diphosphohydrolase
VAADTYDKKFALVYTRLRERQALGSPARFVCALALAGGGGILYESRGTIEGVIADGPRGDGGFGYDPIFFSPAHGRTLAQLTEEEKAVVSHRGRAFRLFREALTARPDLLRR